MQHKESWATQDASRAYKTQKYPGFRELVYSLQKLLLQSQIQLLHDLPEHLDDRVMLQYSYYVHRLSESQKE